MNGIEKITARIAADADQEIAQLKAQAQQEADAILLHQKALAAEAGVEITQVPHTIWHSVQAPYNHRDKLRMPFYSHQARNY